MDEEDFKSGKELGRNLIKGNAILFLLVAFIIILTNLVN